MPVYLIVIGIVVVVILIAIALYYHVRLFIKNKAVAENNAVLIEEAKERKKRNANSVLIISRAVLDDQVSLTEASIRVTALAPTLGLSPQTLDQLSAFQQLAEATAHIPILDKWKALSKKEKAGYTLEREKIEEKFESFVKRAAKKVVSNEISLF